ncbi:MAG: alpha/beta hydrolase [Cyclobacteriaceae bacterium]|nr:alpha/beta hydrolase [Cyclobacteriaceae bacterium HetDA_MAG_MS6]
MLYFEKVFRSVDSHWVVFLHGAGGSTKTWTYQLDDFGQHFNLLLIDLRDHGSSKSIGPEEEKYCFQLISSDIVEVLEHVGIQSAYFITLSFGSVLMQDLSMRYPGLVKKAIFAGGIFRGSIPIRLFVYLAKLLNPFLSYPSMYRMFSFLLMPRKRNQKARRLYTREASKLKREEYMKWVGLYREFFVLLRQFYDHLLAHPSLVIMGDEDYVFLSDAKQYVMGQPGASLQVIPATGHICNIESPKAFNQIALAYLLH